MPLDRFLHLRRLLVEGLRRRSRRLLGEEPLWLVSAQHRCACPAIVPRKALSSRHDGQIPGHHAPVAKSLAAHRGRRSAPGAEPIHRNGRDRLTNALIARRQPQVGESIAVVQRGHSADAAIDVRDVGDVHHGEARAVLPVPGEEAITRTDRQPAHRSESDGSSQVAAESEERHVGRRPHRPIVAVNRSRPPHPGTSIEEPAAVVIGRPSPRFVRDPRPAPVRLPDPAAVAIGGPARGHDR